MVCAGAEECHTQESNCLVDAIDQARTLKQLLEQFVGWTVLDFKDTLQRFPEVHALAQFARCSYSGDWPPVHYVYAPGFRGVRQLVFSPTLWGKYMFRVHSVAGVRS